MKFLSRVLLCFVSLFCFPSAWSQSLPSPDEEAVRALAEAFFQTRAARDRAAYERLWHEQAPGLDTHLRGMTAFFAYRDSQMLLTLTVQRVKIEGNKAWLRVTVETQIRATQTQEITARFKRLMALECTKAAGQWKVWREELAAAELARALLATTDEEKRASLLAAEPELVTADLVHELNVQGNRLMPAEAIAANQLAARLGEHVGDHLGAARSLTNVGTQQRLQGDFAPAIASFQQSLSYYETLQDKLGKTRVLNQLALTRLFHGEVAAALEAAQQALTLAKELGNETEIAAALYQFGRIHTAQGEFASAFTHLQQSLTIRERLRLKGAVADTLLRLGTLDLVQNNYAQALAYDRKSLTISEELKDNAIIMWTLVDIGDAYLSQNNYATALTYFQKSLALSEAMQARAMIATTLNSIGTLHRLQGNYAQALSYHRQSLSLNEARKDKGGIAAMMNNIGMDYHSQRDYARALEHYTQSHKIWQALGDKGGEAATLNNLAQIYLAQGNAEKALTSQQMAIALGVPRSSRISRARRLNTLSLIYEKLSQPAQALEAANQAAALAQEVGQLDTLTNARFRTGMAQRALQQPTQARASFAEAIALVETQRTQVAGGEEEQQRFFATNIPPYHALMELYNAEGNAPEALRLAERAKSRVLLDVLQHGRVNITKALTASEREQERKLRGELTALNYQINFNANLPNADKLNILKERREKARLSYEAFQTTLYAAHPELQTQRGEAPIIKAEELSALLPDANSALLEFVVTEELTMLFVVTKANAKADVQTFTLPIKRESLAQQIEAFRQQLAARDLGFRATATKLYDLLLKPAQAQLNGKTNLILVPDDKLWELPFQALVNHANRFLIEDATIAYAPSLTVLREMTKRRTPNVHAGATLLALGNPTLGQETIARAALTLRDGKLAPLPEAEQEVKALGQLYPGSKIYLGAEAREDRVKAEAASTRILHFATHGVLNNATPMYSHLLLTPGTAEEDGLLEAWELMQMDLQAELAVLSACETARGRYGAGEGMIGLSWALFVAGVPTTVVSQWKVESASTRDLMLRFHRGLQTGKTSKAEALRQASLSLLRQPATSHPFYWASFVLVGNPQ